MFYRKINLILLLISFLLIGSLKASVTITDKINKLDNFTIKYYYDESSQLNIEDIVKISFNENLSNKFTKGYRYGNAWFKIVLNNKSRNEDFVLYFTESIWTTLDLYTMEDSLWKIHKNGLNIPIEYREIKDSSPAFHLHIKENETVTIYIKGQTIASQIGEFQIFTKDEYFNPSRITLADKYIIFSFVLFSFILLNLYNFFMTKEAIYGYYVLYVSIFIVFITMHSGIYINFGFPNWQEGLHTLGQLTLVTLLLFSNEFLELKKNYPRMRKIFFLLSIGAFIFALLLSQNAPYATVASNIYFSGVLITIVYVAISVLRKGFEGAKYYLLALMFYLPSMTIMAMNFNTLLPNTDFTRYLFLAGAFFEIFLFTLILTNRYKYIRELNNLLITKTNQLKDAKKQIKQESITDFLTKIYNRRYFKVIFPKMINSAKRKNDMIAFLIMDIDFFKQYNDTYGHQKGDIVLVNVAKTIYTSLNRVDDYCFRLGGEEFGVLFKVETKEKAKIFADSIRKNIENLQIEHKNNTASPYVTVSMGLVCKKAIEVYNKDTLYKQADDLLYEAKKSGRNILKTF